MTKNPSSPELRWLASLASAADQLPLAARPRPYYSQRQVGADLLPAGDLAAGARRVRAVVREFDQDHFFAETLGFDCVDSNGESDSSHDTELERRVGKPHLWEAEPELWSRADLCDFVEVFHDLAARPTAGYFHSYMGCGFHPMRFSRKSGQALYRWRINQVLATTSLDLRLAQAGEDLGRMVHVAPGELGQLIDDVLCEPSVQSGTIAHAIALFRSRDGTPEEHRSAIVALAGVLEQRRDLLKDHLLTKDENALFEIANRYDLRHQRADQHGDYGPEFLEWIFYWYLGTVQLTERLLERSDQSRSAQNAPSKA